MADFPQLYGNAVWKKRVGDAIRNHTLSHAYLLEGPAGSGRRHFARMIAAALACENPGESLPCLVCPKCRRLMENNTPDLREVSRGENASVRIEAIRELREDMYLSPTENEDKVYLIDDADAMTVQAQNALLIVLEEPPPHVRIFLLAEDANALLPTIRSRVQKIPMERFRDEEVGDYLMKNNAEAARLAKEDLHGYRALMKECGGTIGGGILLLDPAEEQRMRQKRGLTEELLTAVAHRRAGEMYTALAALPQKRQELLDAFSRILRAVRDMILVKKSMTTDMMFYESRKKAEDMAAGMGVFRLLQIDTAIRQAAADVEKNANVNTVLSSLLGELR